MERGDDEQARGLAEARATLLAGLGLTLEQAQRLGIDVAHLDAVVSQGLSLKEAIDRGLLTIPPELASELMGESIRKLQQHAVAKSVDRMTDEEIEDEIKAARASRPDQPR